MNPQVAVEDIILSDPIIVEAIKQGTVMIHGNRTEAAAKELARKIKP
jgi:hypothetical protein